MELERKQGEIISLNSLLAQWVVKYIDLEKNKTFSLDSPRMNVNSYVF